MKMHKKLYKAGKNWLVATIMTGAAVMTFSTINAHADQVIPGANSQPQASAVAQVQGPSANSQSQPVAQQANVKVAATIDNNQNLQQRINQVQQSVDQQTQVVKQQQAMVDQAWNDYSQKINQSVSIDDEVKSTSQAYNNQKAQADTLYDQYNSLYEKEMAIKAQQEQVQQGSQYQSLLQQAKALCPGYYTGTYSEKLQSVVDLQKNNLSQYNQFESLQKQMTDLLGNLPTQFSQAIDAAMMAFNKWKTVNDALENGSARQAYRDALAKQRDASAATQAANLVWNNAKQKLDQDQAQLATLTAQLTALKQQLHEQTLSCTVTYVDAQGRTVGTEVLSGKDGQTFTSADLHLPVNYQLATGTAVSITLNAQTTAVTVNVVSTPAKVVHVTVNFVDAQSQQQLGSQVLTGQPGQQFTDHDLTIPAGYVFDNASQGAFVITIGEQDDSTTIYLTRQQVKKTGFQHEDGGVFYYDQDGNRVMGEQVIDGHTYFFNPKANGLMATGIAEEKMGDPYYLFNDQGQKQGAGEHLYHGKWYYCDPNNNDAVATGFTKLPDGRTVYYSLESGITNGEAQIQGHWYHFSEQNGDMSKGFLKLHDGRIVYYDENGILQNGLTKATDGYTYYFSLIDGNMYRGEKQINDHWYYFDVNNGRMATGFQKLPDGRIVYYNQDGILQNGLTKAADGFTYYLSKTDGNMYRGEKQINGHWYYFDVNNGRMATGFQKLPDGRIVYYNQDGILQNGLTKATDGFTYYLSETDGNMYRGEKQINGHWYYFDVNNGRMATGFQKLPDGRIVYYNQDGILQNGLTKATDGFTYYLSETDGNMYRGEKQMDGHWYYFDVNNGRMATGFTTLPDGRHVYYDEDGKLLNGIQVIDGKKYLFSNIDGHMLTGVSLNTDVDKLMYFNRDGVAQTSSQIIDGIHYTFDENGYLLVPQGELHLADHWYLIGADSQVKIGFQMLPDGRTLYYSPTTGQAANGEANINGNWYFFDYNDGHEYKNAFAQLRDGRITYYDGNGHIVNGERQIDGYWYHFDENNGNMSKGFTNLPDGRTVYYDQNGHIVNGWQTINGHQYFFSQQNGALDYNATLVNAWRSIINNYSNPISIAIQSKRTGQVYSYTNRPGHHWRMASTVKVSVLAQLLHNTGGNLNSYQQQLATNMIRYSDNNATQTIVDNYLGGDMNLRYIFADLGMQQTYASWHWGSSTTIASDQLKLLNEIYLSNNHRYLNQQSCDYIAGLMHSVTPSQQWGISAGSGNYYIKNGWVPDPATNWCVNSIGYIPRSGNDGYTIAIYSDYNNSMQNGINIDEQLARVTAEIMV